MKQHISIDDLNQLSERGKGKLRKWWKPMASDVIYNPDTEDLGSQAYITPITGYYPLLSIGQMIEFLDERYELQVSLTKPTWTVLRTRTDDFGEIDKKLLSSGYELCDALWEAVKEVLEQNPNKE